MNKINDEKINLKNFLKVRYYFKCTKNDIYMEKRIKIFLYYVLFIVVFIHIQTMIFYKKVINNGFRK